MVRRTWKDREQRLLEAIGAAEEEGREARADEPSSPTGLTQDQVERGLPDLHDGYIEGIDVTAQGDIFDGEVSFQVPAGEAFLPDFVDARARRSGACCSWVSPL